MNNETATIPIFIRLFERQGHPTELLVSKIQKLADEIGVTDDISLEQIRPRDNNPSQNLIIYVINTKPTRQRHSIAIGSFLEQIFSQYFDNHPSFEAPLASYDVETAEKAK